MYYSAKMTKMVAQSGAMTSVTNSWMVCRPVLPSQGPDDAGRQADGGGERGADRGGRHRRGRERQLRGVRHHAAAQEASENERDPTNNALLVNELRCRIFCRQAPTERADRRQMW